MFANDDVITLSMKNNAYQLLENIFALSPGIQCIIIILSNILAGIQTIGV